MRNNHVTSIPNSSFFKQMTMISLSVKDKDPIVDSIQKRLAIIKLHKDKNMKEDYFVNFAYRKLEVIYMMRGALTGLLKDIFKYNVISLGMSDFVL